jgi:hypothetical protein
MSATKLRTTTLGIVMALVLVSGFPIAAFAETTSTTVIPTTTTPVDPVPVLLPFEEMLPGIYVAYEWWNETGQDWGYEISPMDPVTLPTFPNITDITDITTITTYPGDEDASWEYPLYMPYHYVEDTDGNPYWIWESFEYEFSYNWSFSNLLVVIILDPDGSYMSFLSRVDWFTQPALYNYWGFLYSPDSQALTGDEVFIYSTFYISEFDSYSYYQGNFTWYDESMTEVDPNTVIPNLKEEYQWASWMNESYEYEYDDSFTSYGFDINEMFLEGDEVQWMDHYFEGLTVFNDTNENGIMDVVFDPVEVDYDEDGIVDWTYYELNETASEIVYNFYADEAEVGTIQFPELNSDNQIEWSAEVIDIKGRLMEPYPTPFWDWCGTEPFAPVEFIEPESLPVSVDRLEMVYRFEVTNDAAVMKIDQHFGDFTDPVSGVIHPDLEGLSLAAKYWSYFSSYTLYDDYYTATVTTAVPVEPSTTDMAGTITLPHAVESGNVADGSLDFGERTSDRSRTSIDFGGEYIWGKDGRTYDVGTTIIPNYYYALPYEMGAPAADLAYDVSQEAASTYYYASCYSEWDGYAITHDPVYTIFPMQAPGSVSWFLAALTNSSLLIGLVGIVATAVVCVRVNSERKRP